MPTSPSRVLSKTAKLWKAIPSSSWKAWLSPRTRSEQMRPTSTCAASSGAWQHSSMRRSPTWRRLVTWETGSSVRITPCTFTPTLARVPTFVERKPPCSNPSKANAAFRASARPSRRSTACTASRPWSTMLRRSPTSLSSSKKEPTGTRPSAQPTAPESRSSRSPGTLTSPATTNCPSAPPTASSSIPAGAA